MSVYFKTGTNLEAFLKTDQFKTIAKTAELFRQDPSFTSDHLSVIDAIITANQLITNNCSIEDAVAINLGEALSKNTKEIEIVVRKICSFLLEQNNSNLKSSLEAIIGTLSKEEQTRVDWLVWRNSPVTNKSGNNWGFEHRFDDLGLLYDILHDEIGGNEVLDCLNQAGIDESPLPTPPSSPVPSSRAPQEGIASPTSNLQAIASESLIVQLQEEIKKLKEQIIESERKTLRKQQDDEFQNGLVLDQLKVANKNLQQKVISLTETNEKLSQNSVHLNYKKRWERVRRMAVYVDIPKNSLDTIEKDYSVD